MLNQTRALWGIARESPLQGPGIRTEAAPESRVNPAYLRGARRCRAKPEAKPDGLSIAIGGIGSSLHLAGEQLKMMADVRILRLLSVASDRPTVPSRVIALSQAPELAWQPRPPWPCAGNSPAGASPPRRCAPSCSLTPPPRQGLAVADAVQSH